MFFKKTKVVLNESTLTAMELCKQALSLSIGSDDFIIKTIMKITTEELKDMRLKVSVSTKFLHQNKVFDFDFEATMVKAEFWILMEGYYVAKATINKQHSFEFKSAGYLKLNFISAVEGVTRSLFKGHYSLA